MVYIVQSGYFYFRAYEYSHIPSYLVHSSFLIRVTSDFNFFLGLRLLLCNNQFLGNCCRMKLLVAPLPTLLTSPCHSQHTHKCQGLSPDLSSACTLLTVTRGRVRREHALNNQSVKRDSLVLWGKKMVFCKQPHHLSAPTLLRQSSYRRMQPNTCWIKNPFIIL